MLFVMYSVIDLSVLSCMQNQFIHLAKTYATTTPKIISLLVPYSVALRCNFDFVQLLYHYFNTGKEEGLLQKESESTLLDMNNVVSLY